MRQLWPPVEMGSIANEFWLFLEFATAFGLDLHQFVQIMEVPIRQRLIGQFP
jgi:hypothetical protein